MKTALIVTVAMLAGGTALAADLPVKAPPAPIPVFSWTGPYVGLNVGYSWGRETVNGTVTGTSTTAAGVTTALAPAPLFGSGSLDGVLGGGQVGYNWQFGTWMVGVEGDLQATGERKTYSVCTISGCPLGSTVLTATNRLSWFGTDRVRIGYLPTERLFLYGTGGLAFGSFRGESGQLVTGPLFGTWSKLKAGWTAGAGLELAIDYAWTFKFEYLYMDFSDISGPTASVAAIAGGTTTVTTFSFKEHFTDNVVRVGINYRFGPGPAPVVAKY